MNDFDRWAHSYRARDVLSVWALFLPGHPGFLDRHLVVDLLGAGGLPGEVGDLRLLITAAHGAAPSERAP